MRIQELEERLESSKKYNNKFSDKAMLIGGTKTGFARFLAQTDNGILWTVRDMINPENHKRRFMTKMELLIYFNGLLNQGFTVSIV